MTTNNELETGSNVANEASTSATQELNPGFTGETITLKEAEDISGKSKVTVLKVIKENKIQSVGQIKSQKRGRPANLYDREELLKALHSA